MSGRTEGGPNGQGRRYGPDVVSLGLATCLAATLFPSRALAHVSDRGHVLLLPTGYYVVGGACAVAASFLVLALRARSVRRPQVPAGVELLSVPEWLRTGTSLLSFLLLAVLVAAGLAGSRDPLSNPLPLTVWTLVWIGLTLVQGVIGNLWRWIDPWYGPARLLAPMLPAPRTWPGWLASWPAVALLFGFAWFELVDVAPDDPYRLGMAVGAYWLYGLAATVVFGHERWSRHGDFLGAFLRLVSAYALLSSRVHDGRTVIVAGLPGHKPAARRPLTLSETLLLLVALACVSFDGFMRTFTWLAALGVNPLEYPGRSALLLANTVGLVGAVCALAGLFFAAVALGRAMAGDGPPFAVLAGRLVWSLVPIALAFHFAHYLVALLVNGQYALVAFSDPFVLGWNLFGTAHMPVVAGIAMGSDAAWLLWNLQAGVIVLGHVAAVLVCHTACAAIHADRRRAIATELPLTILMIGYTVFGLWLLSTPTGA